MKAASIAQIRSELKELSQPELAEVILKLARFKKDNKELLSYVLFDSYNENQYIQAVKSEVDKEFSELNLGHVYYAKKGVRKIQRNLKKAIRYSGKVTTEIELSIYFGMHLNQLVHRFRNNLVLEGILIRQINAIEKKLGQLHPDEQLDYQEEIDFLKQ